MTAEFIALIFGGYLLGSIPSSYIAARLYRGVDIRRYGSGNVGGSNLFKLVPLWIAIPSFAFDILKGTMPVFIASLLNLTFTEQAVVGAAAIAGHNWPVFLRFNGGRGIATTLGVTLFLMPKLTALLLSIVLISIIFHQMALLTIVVISVFPIAGYFSKLPVMSFLMDNNPPDAERLGATLGLFMIFFITALRRLTAPKSELAAGLRPGELYLNRLLWDRDIRDREAWVNRNMGQSERSAKRTGEKGG